MKRRKNDLSRDSNETTGSLTPKGSPLPNLSPPPTAIREADWSSQRAPPPSPNNSLPPSSSPPMKRPSARSPLADESTGAEEVMLRPESEGGRAYEKKSTRRRSYSEGFVPRPYMFVMNGKEVLPDAVSQARMPPYWMLLDHTFAIIFCMCSPQFKEKPSLGISQLTWSLELLKTVKSRRGTYKEDVKTLIGAIEDRILNCYAAIGVKEQEAIEKLQEQESKQQSDKFKPFANLDSEIPDDMEYSDFKSGLGSPTPTAAKTPSAPMRKREPAQPRSVETSSSFEPSDEVNYDSILKQAEELREQEQQQQRGGRSMNVTWPSNETTGNITSPYQGSEQVDFDSVVKHIEAQRDPYDRRVLSVTFDEVMARAPPPAATPKKGPRGLAPRRLFAKDSEDREEDDAKLKDTTVKNAISRQNLMKFFSSWRQEQVERLQVEMQRLSNIEEFMAKIDENFERVLDEETMKRLQEFKAGIEPSKQKYSDRPRMDRTI